MCFEVVQCSHDKQRAYRRKKEAEKMVISFNPLTCMSGYEESHRSKPSTF